MRLEVHRGVVSLTLQELHAIVRRIDVSSREARGPFAYGVGVTTVLDTGKDPASLDLVSSACKSCGV